MIVLLNLDDVKLFLRLDTNVEDGYLNILILLAGEMSENYIRTALPDPLPESIRQAMLMVIGYFFENREGTKENIPSVVFTLLNPYRKAVF